MTSVDDGMGIGGRVRAARQRRGWTREALAFHAGISWSAITQLEAGRRRNLRPSTLAALAGALGVTVDYLVSGCAVSSEMLEHRALVYESDAEFLAAAVPFFAGARDRPEAAVAVTSEAHGELLREQHQTGDPRVEFADRDTWCDSPGLALSRFRAFVTGHIATGALWVRILVEPMAAGRSPAETRAWATYESLLNLVFRSAPVTLLCAYDAGDLDAELLAQVLVTHPHTLTDAGVTASSEYLDPLEFVLQSVAGAGGRRRRQTRANR